MWKRLSLLWLVIKGDLERLWHALRHPDAPSWLKGGTALLALYLLSPVDLIPDFIPFFGVLDDVIVIPAAIRWMLGRLPGHIRDHAERHAAGRHTPKTDIEEVR
jgi:uncharacterized membrane protein YkvA (DUF1232 family)